MAADVLGLGMQDHFKGVRGFNFSTYLELPGIGRPITDTFSPGYFFRGYDTMPHLEQEALALCRGKILDIGCGAGCHSLYLQRNGMDVTALDTSAGAIETCRLRGIKKTVNKDILTYTGTKFDTIMLLMNGIGIAGNIGSLDGFIGCLKKLLAANGQVILDSSDISYMYQEHEDSSFEIPENGEYYGEGRFVVEYRGKRGHAFDWLYLDPEQLAKAAMGKGLICDIVSLGSHYDYLARLTKR